MLSLKCACGAAHEVPETFLNEPAECVGCGKTVYAVGGIPDVLEDPVKGRLLIVEGPQRVGQQFFLVGMRPIEVGKLPEKDVPLAGTRVSRNHCRLIRSDAGWRIEDLRSTNGVLVNNQRVTTAELKNGDTLQIGEYQIKYTSSAVAASDEPEECELEEIGAYDLAEAEETFELLPSAPAAGPAHQAAAAPTGGPICPCCEKSLARNAKVCVACGIRVPSGRPLIISRGLDENDMAERSNTWIRLVSLVLPLGLFPVASEAFGAHKARVVWIITALTVVISAWWLISNIGSETTQHANLMLWAGSADATARAVERIGDGDEHSRKDDATLRRAALVAGMGSDAEFHGYQLITHAFLHGGILHLAGNLLFLIVFGLRVNEAVGDLRAAILYPLLILGAGVCYLIAMSNAPLHPCLGASGAIMGLAGMYFVFFPVQRVHVAFWIRIRLIWMRHKVFRMRGFWLLLMWVAFNDVLPVFIGSGSDGVAHWAHLGGFLTGMALAIILLATRLGHSHGGDLLSVCLGKYAWPLIGKPNRWLAEVVPSPEDANRPRRVVLANRYF